MHGARAAPKRGEPKSSERSEGSPSAHRHAPQSAASMAMAMRLPPGPIQRKCTACAPAAPCAACEEERIQRKAADGAPAPASAPALTGRGTPLDAGTRGYFEPLLARDLSGVRIHAGGDAAGAAQAIHAEAFTSGQDIAFGAGRYAPGTDEGRRLLAHELVHVVQQERSGPSVAPSGLSSPDDAAEREADSAADALVRGRAVSPRAAPSASVHRKMHNKAILEPVRTDAKACVVHLHGEEHTAAAVARELYGRRCVNYVHLDTESGPLKGTDQRYVEFDIDVGGVNFTITADPNRVFSDKGRRVDAIHSISPTIPKTIKRSDVVDAAAAELKTFVDTAWGAGISSCRGGKGTGDLSGPLPVLALHNNEGDDPILDKYKPQWAPKTDPRLKGGPNPDYSGDPKNKSDVFFVADPPPAAGASASAPDFDAIKGTYNVGLQAQPVPASGEDGSLSVALQNERFINVEKKGRNQGELVDLGGGFKGHSAGFVKNYAMATKALDVLGVPDGPCGATTPVPTAPQNTPATPTPATPEAKPATTGTTAPPSVDTEAKASDTDPYPLETVDAKAVPKGCQTFPDMGALQSHKSDWDAKLRFLPLTDTLNWILGAWNLEPGPARAVPPLVQAGVNEARAQRSCLLEAMVKGVKAQKGKVPTTAANLVKSGQRSYSDQEGIWKDKFNFTGKAFDKISAFAAAKSKGLLTAGDQWDPAKRLHKLMWGTLAASPSSKNADEQAFIAAGAVPLTDDERQKEILQASSAPGVSRHHAATDFDIGDTTAGGDQLQSKLWQPGEKYFDLGRWLFHNAATWGFMRPFDTKGGYGTGYMKEEWHWSYWPIAQALLDFARKNQSDMEAALHAHWGGTKASAEFTFIWSAWKSFLTNVDETPRF